MLHKESVIDVVYGKEKAIVHVFEMLGYKSVLISS